MSLVNYSSQMSPFLRWFRLVGTPLLGAVLYGVVYYIDPLDEQYPEYRGANAWQAYCFDLVLCIVGSVILSEISIWDSRQLDRILPWERKPLLRFIIQVISLTIASVLIIELIVYLVTLYEEPNYQLSENDRLSIRQTVVIGSMMALFINAIYTGEFFLRRWKTALMEAEALKRESVEARYEALKSQLDPHFLFNNLNTLTYLVEDNPAAVKFVENLSLVYRYILQNRDKTLVPLADELRLAESYLALLKERFGEGLQVSIDIPTSQFDRQLPPLTLQLLLENAVKHNVVDVKSPLHITIRLNEAGELVVENSLRRRQTLENRAGIGLQNIRHRYQLTANVLPIISENADQFTVRLPLL